MRAELAAPRDTVTATPQVEASVAVAAAVATPPVTEETMVERVAERAEPRVEAVAPAPQWAPAPEPAVAWAPEPAPKSVAPPAAPAPKPDLDSALRDSGLVLIETKADRVQPAVSDVEDQPVVRQRRERRPPPADLNAPLMQVETHTKGEGDAPPPQ